MACVHGTSLQRTLPCLDGMLSKPLYKVNTPPPRKKTCSPVTPPPPPRGTAPCALNCIFPKGEWLVGGLDSGFIILLFSEACAPPTHVHTPFSFYVRPATHFLKCSTETRVLAFELTSLFPKLTATFRLLRFGPCGCAGGGDLDSFTVLSFHKCHRNLAVTCGD